MSAASALLWVATTLAPAPEPDRPPVAPGGYWSISEQRERRGEPPDGDDELTIGSVLFSLGLLRTGAAAVTVWLARTPGRCPLSDPSGCGSLEIYGWFGVGEGGLMVGTGLTYLIIGAVRRSRHQRWQRGESVGLHNLEVGPWLIPAVVDRSGVVVAGPVGAQLRWRF